MQTIDIIISVLVVWGVVKGFTRGLISEVAQLAALVLGCIFATRFSFYLSDFLIETFILSDKIVPIISFILIFIGVLLGVIFLAKALTNLTKAIALGWLNRSGGMIFGGLKFLLIAGIILQLIITNDMKQKIISAESREKSALLNPTLDFTNFLSPYLKKALFDKQ